MTESVFLYGTLRDPVLYNIVSGTPLKARPATLEGFAVHRVEGENFPVLIGRTGAAAHGALVQPDETARARLDFYEGGFGYVVQLHDVITETGLARSAVYVPTVDRPAGETWSLTAWQKQHGALARMAAQDYMFLRTTHTPEEAARAFPQVRVRAASRLRAQVAPSPAVFSPEMSAKAVATVRTEKPYTDYFAVREDWLSFPTFDGGTSALVKRASFLGGDAVTVLPYDPATDSVLIIRQFRHGPFARGDSNPWTLEPAAGRIDPGETPEETATRELFEETSVAAQSLHFVGRYYPSPGAFSEYLYSYVAVADLSDADGGVGGLEDEAEDILRHVVPLGDALAMIQTGAINTGPLALSLYWLAVNKSGVS